jgi:hypothetical protein
MGEDPIRLGQEEHGKLGHRLTRQCHLDREGAVTERGALDLQLERRVERQRRRKRASAGLAIDQVERQREQMRRQGDSDGLSGSGDHQLAARLSIEKNIEGSSWQLARTTRI